MKALQDLFTQGKESTKEEADKIAQEIWKGLAELQYTIGVVGGITGWPRLTNNDLGNIPEGISQKNRFPSQSHPQTWYWRIPERRE